MKKLIINIATGWAKSAALAKIRTNAVIKDVVHSGNRKLAEKVKIKGSGIDGVNYGKDLIDLGQKYIDAYSNDGEIDTEELRKIDTACDEMVDKYLPDEKISSWIDIAFDWVKELVAGLFK